MTDNPFDAVRAQVSCLDAGQRYGLAVNRSGFALCPWHADGHPSLKLYGPGRGCYCFSCNHSSDVIGLTAELLGQDRLTAARTLNKDYGLGLEIGAGRNETPEQRAKREAEAKKRRELAQIYRDFTAWREEIEGLVISVYRLGWTALNELPETLWLDAEVEAIRMLPTLEFWLNLLGGNTDDQMTVFRERKKVRQKCETIMDGMPRRFRQG